MDRTGSMSGLVRSHSIQICVELIRSDTIRFKRFRSASGLNYNYLSLVRLQLKNVNRSISLDSVGGYSPHLSDLLNNVLKFLRRYLKKRNV